MILIVGSSSASLTYVYYRHQDPVYGAATEIYLGSGSRCRRCSAAAKTAVANTDRRSPTRSC